MTATGGVFRDALDLYHAGRAAEAERLCRRVVDEAPGHAEGWHLLGLIALGAGRPVEALELAGRAIELHGGNPVHYNTLGLALAARNDARGAAEQFRLATLLAPHFAEAHANLGAALRNLGDWPGAEASLTRALDLKPEFAAARLTLGLGRRSLGRLVEAADDFRAALRLDPNSVAARSALAGVLRTLGLPHETPPVPSEPLAGDSAEARLDRAIALLIDGRPADALEECRRALLLRPGFPEALSTEGLALLKLGRPEEAEPRLREALLNAPGLVEARHQLALALLAQGRPAEAAETLDHLVENVPENAEVQRTLIRANLACGRYEAAGAACRRVIALCPGKADARGQLAMILADQGRTAEAEGLLHEALRLEPSDRLRVLHATLLPPFYDSTAELDDRRQTLAENLDRLAREGVRIEATVESFPTLFYLAYQGRNDRDLHRAFARLVTPPEAVPPRPRPRVQGRKLRVGFFSVHFFNHTVGRLMKGMVAHLPRDSFEVVALSDARHDDEIGRFIARSADAFVTVPRDARAARAAVAACGLDVLVYTDLGMDSLTYALACARLAPVQCLTWGHPATSGLDTLDYFLSSELLEIPEADTHYTERLVRLPALPVVYERPTIPVAPKSRSAIGLPETGHLYACPQTLYKLHPEFDALLGAVLRRDPEGRLVLLRGRHPHWDEQLRARFARTIPDVLDRVVTIPPLRREDFLHLNATVDVLLDPIHFGGGNTTYEALAFGTPVVTLPSPYLKGRITQSLYRRMGVSSCVAATPEEYVAIAVRLGTDDGLRAAVRAEILASCPALYDDTSGVHALATFLREVAGD
jgi:predicted O-linked N-acetylglucosamine transferase (SPINDLY family)